MEVLEPVAIEPTTAGQQRVGIPDPKVGGAPETGVCRHSRRRPQQIARGDRRAYLQSILLGQADAERRDVGCGLGHRHDEAYAVGHRFGCQDHRSEGAQPHDPQHVQFGIFLRIGVSYLGLDRFLDDPLARVLVALDPNLPEDFAELETIGNAVGDVFDGHQLRQTRNRTAQEAENQEGHEKLHQ